MNQLTNLNLIDEKKLDRGFYFQSLFLEVCNKHLLSKEQIERIQMELIDLMAKEVERYTNDESTSVPIEKAQQLLQSITYSIGLYLKSISDMAEKLNKLKCEKVTDLFHHGMEMVNEMVNKAKQLLRNLLSERMILSNYAYQDTISMGLAKFFHDYNIEFGAFEIPADIDYPLFSTITDLLGVEYMYEYLKCLTLENNFVIHFPKDKVELLLLGFDKSQEHMLINIFEIVFVNALGCTLIGQEMTQLNIPQLEQKWLRDSLKNLGSYELKQKLENATNEIIRKLALEGELASYLNSALPQILQRINNNIVTDTLNRIFISFPESNKEEEILDVGIPMEDEKLREVMEKINRCRLISDKVAIIQSTVRSLPDMFEIMEECFLDHEYQEVFQMLSKTDRNFLKKYIIMEAGAEKLEDFEPEKNWQRILFQM